MKSRNYFGGSGHMEAKLHVSLYFENFGKHTLNSKKKCDFFLDVYYKLA
jgi:hypothetical protein